jgi:hypothetical protein
MRPLIAVLLTVLATPALAQPVAAFDTALVKGQCRFIEDDGEVGHYALKRCPGLGGASVYTEAGVQSVGLYFGWGKTHSPSVLKSDSIGLKVEWRGRGTKAAFTPHATIITAIVKDREAEKNYNVLAVIRMEKRNACLMALIDEGNPDALTLARTTADTEASTFSCKTGKPRVVGAPSHWAQQIIGFKGDIPD